jgi:N-acetylglucosaminyl-diphospho-decaprenol L-rhamnosyltransferase
MTRLPPQPRLSIVIVAWESGRDLLDCIRSLAEARPTGEPGPELIVVDNGSRDFPAEEVVPAWPHATLLRNEGNRGFGPAANQGVAVAHGDIVLLLNPDTRALGKPLEPLLAAFAQHASAVAVAPRLVETEPSTPAPLRTPQLRRLPTLAQATREMFLLDRAFPHNRWLARDRYLDRDPDQAFEVAQPAGAALAFRRDVFLRLGGFDEAFVPAWFEDVDLCARLRREGSILYWPASRFAHAGGTAARTLGYDVFLPTYYSNALRYWRKHHGPAGAFAYRTLIGVGMLLRLVALPIVGAPAPRRVAARAFTRAFWGAAGFGRCRRADTW